MIFNTSLLTITIQQVAIQPCKGVGVVRSEKVWLILFSTEVLLYHYTTKGACPQKGHIVS